MESSHRVVRTAGREVLTGAGTGWRQGADIAYLQAHCDYISRLASGVERLYNVKHWTDMPRGGHFAALEQPELLCKDIREFFAGFRTDQKA
jgi:pimeloyl-ACP methyl ester carboxylesterase